MTKKQPIKRNQAAITILLLMMVILTIIPVQAQTITMANPQGITERDIIVYWPNGTMQGYYNSTSVIALENTSDYIFTIKPVSSNPFEDPADWLVNYVFPFVQTNFIGIAIIFAFIIWWRKG